MFSEQILPRLDSMDGVILFSMLHLAGMGESDVGATIKDLMVREGDVVVGTTASGGMVSARITVRAASAQQGRTLIEQTVTEIRRRLGDHVFGQDQTTLAGAVGELLQQKGQTLATAESCTGGLIAKLLTDVSGSSSHYRGTVVAYENDVKTCLLGVDEKTLCEHGAVSEPVAEAMARNARERIGADWAISTTGIAGPSGGTDQKPVGLVYIGIAGEDGCEVFKRHYPGDRETMRLRTALGGLNELRMRLLRSVPEPEKDG
jgi:nicotinamide-nucleotide amidase